MNFHTHEAAGPDKNGPRAPDDFFFCHTPARRASERPGLHKTNSRFLVARPRRNAGGLLGMTPTHVIAHKAKFRKTA
jgi:hypothetical protein